MEIIGRMLTSNQQQQNQEQIYANNVIPNGNITATPLSSVIPVMVPVSLFLFVKYCNLIFYCMLILLSYLTLV